jgi:NAD+ diphosphatase
MRPEFLPTTLAPDPLPPESLCFAFQSNRLLVRRSRPADHPAAAVPPLGALLDLGLRPARRQFLGTSGGRPCLAWDLEPGTAEPSDLQFAELRGLWGLLPETEFWLAGRAFQIVDWDRTHQYCGRCAAPLQAKSDERAKQCPACGLQAFPRVAPAIIVAVVRGDALLLARASRFPTDLYSVIAGFVDAGESLEECVHREVREEVGLRIGGLRYFASQPWPFPHSLMVAFTARHESGEIAVDGREIVDAGWYRAGELPRIPERISVSRQLIDWFVSQQSESASQPDKR